MAKAEVASVLLVGTHVVVDVLESDPEWADWSIGQLRAQAKVHLRTPVSKIVVCRNV